MTKKKATPDDLARTIAQVVKTAAPNPERYAAYETSFYLNQAAKAVFRALTEECGFDEAEVFVLADMLLTRTALTLQEKRGRQVAEARYEVERQVVEDEVAIRR